MIVSNKVPFGKKGFKYFIVYKSDRKVRLLCIILPKMCACRRFFDETKYFSFFLKHNQLLEKYNKIWDKISNSKRKDLIVNLYTMKII